MNQADKRATTFRIEPIVMAGLEKLSRITKRPLNKLVNEAIREFVARRVPEIEGELESTLAELREYRKRDPRFERAIAEFVEAEASATEDPAEGKVAERIGPARKTVRQLLNE